MFYGATKFATATCRGISDRLMLAALCKHTVPGGLPTLTIWIQSSWIVRTALGQMAFLFADKACREWELRCVGQGEGAVVKLIRSQLQLQKKVAGDLRCCSPFPGKVVFRQAVDVCSVDPHLKHISVSILLGQCSSCKAKKLNKTTWVRKPIFVRLVNTINKRFCSKLVWRLVGVGAI